MLRLSVSLANRLPYRAKFAVVGALVACLIALLLIQAFSAAREQIGTAENELRGLRYSDRVRPLIVLLQQHRGLSAIVLNGNDARRNDLAAKGEEVRVALSELDATDARLGAALGTSEHWKSLRGRIEGLIGSVPSLDAPRSFREHTALIGALKDFLADIADASGITLDPEADTYYLTATLTVQVPELLEAMGQLRAKGSGALARGNLPDTERLQLLFLQQRIDQAAAVLEKNLRRVFAASPAAKAALERDGTATHQQAAELSATTTGRILEARSLDLPPGQYFDQATAAMAPGIQLWQAGLGQAEKLIEARVARLERGFAANAGTVAAAALLMLWLFYGFYRSIMDTIVALRRGAQSLAAGDLTTRLEVDTRDELRLVAEAFGAMADRFRELISEVHGTAEQVAASATELASSADQISVATNEQSEAAASTAAAVEEVTVSIGQVAAKSGDAASLSHGAHDCAVKGEEVMRESAQKMSSIASAMTEVAHNVSTLENQSERIGGIVHVIKEIADQTNLLALNAAIEAARAGEQGRGFAVVADEVRKLAERTAASTVQIADLIAQMQKNTTDMVSRIEAGGGLVREGVSYSESAARTLTDIRAGARNAQLAINDIASATREQSSAAHDIARHVERIAQMTEETSSVTHATADSARNLDRLAAALRGMVGRFRV